VVIIKDNPYYVLRWHEKSWNIFKVYNRELRCDV